MIARRISLFTGLFLFAFLFAHLVNLSLGLVSIDAMDRARGWMLAPWTNKVGGMLLAISLCFHTALGLRALYLRNTLRLSRFDAFQLLLGLSIPLLLFPHMITMAMLPAMTEVHATYRQILSLFWMGNPWLGLRQIVGLMVVWLHSCMGLFIWMRLQSWWSKVSLIVYPTVVLLPTLAMLGFVEAGKEVIADAQPAPSVYQSSSSTGEAAYPDIDSFDGNGYQNYAAGNSASNSASNSAGKGESDSETDSYKSSGQSSAQGQANAFSALSDQSRQLISRVVVGSVYGYLGLLLLALAARALRLRRTVQQARVKIGSADEIVTTSGVSLLEVSRLHDIAHASLCGGKGRCGTCQVAIVSGQEHLTAPTAVETRKLQQIDAADSVRLACQARLAGGYVHVEPVLPAYVVADDMPHRRAAAVRSAGLAEVSNEASVNELADGSIAAMGDRS